MALFQTKKSNSSCHLLGSFKLGPWGVFVLAGSALVSVDKVITPSYQASFITNIMAK
jgi:hypothetical protein